jgi:hypothetical protein
VNAQVGNYLNVDSALAHYGLTEAYPHEAEVLGGV